MWQSVTFDTERGLGRVRWLHRAPPRPAGWTYKHKGTWYAVWNRGTDLVFQVGARKLAMTDAFHCSNVRLDGVRRFSIADREGTVFELTYKAVDRDDDPTFDAAELEATDFFVWTTKLWGDPKWRKEVVQNWTASGAA